MVEMENGDFELDGFRLPGSKAGPLYVMAVARSASRDRIQDSLNPLGDDINLGRDLREPPVWGFSFRVGHGDAGRALSSLAALTQAWEGAERGPGDESILRYMVNNRVRRMYGRPRNLSPDPGQVWAFGRIVASAEFHMRDRLYYGDAQESTTLSLLPEESGGLMSPLVSPLTSVAGSARQGQVWVGGDTPTPPRILFRGPVTNPYAASTGWRVQLNLQIGPRSTVTVDTRTGTVTRDDGANLPGALSRGSYLPDVRLRLGSREIIFGGTDATGTATCTVSWRPAYISL